MKHHFLGTFVGLMLSGLLTFPLVNLAEEVKLTKKADMPTPRCCLSTSVVNGKIYAIGGSYPWGVPIPIVEEYDPVSDTWTKKADMPTARMNLSTCVVNGKIYAIGGYIRRDSAISIVEEYDPATDTWTKKEDMPTARSNFSTNAVDGKIYAIGGWGNWGNAIHLSAVEEYDPVKNRWRERKDMPVGRYSFSASVVNGKIYVIGGSRGGGVMPPLLRLSTVEEYSPLGNIWREKKKMPISGTVYTNTIDEKIYVIGFSVRPMPVVKVMEYDPVSEKKKKKAEIPWLRWIWRWGFSTSVVNEKIYVIGGGIQGDEMVSTVEEFDIGLFLEAREKLSSLWGKIKVKD